MDLEKIEGLKDFHMHTKYCDGTCTAEEMVLAAMDKGLGTVGFSGHSFTPFDQSYCMSEAGEKAYRQEVNALKAKYRGRIDIYCGIEMDHYAKATDSGPEAAGAGWDYVIGSVHYIRVPVDRAVRPAAEEAFCSRVPGIYEVDGWAYIPMDDGADIIAAAADRYFGGDVYSLAEEYFRTVGEVVDRTGADLIGHFDLITKYNGRGGGLILDEGHPRYVRAWQAAADRLLATRVPFEINYGAVNKGYRDDPYPTRPIRDYIKSRGGSFILSSDSHRAETIACWLRNSDK